MVADLKIWTRFVNPGPDLKTAAVMCIEAVGLMRMTTGCNCLAKAGLRECGQSEGGGLGALRE